MRPPNWFYFVIAVCLVTVTAAFTIRFLKPEHDWERDTDRVGAFDKKTATWCYYNRDNDVYSCTDLKDGRRLVMRH